jgi:hypothetical protein
VVNISKAYLILEIPLVYNSKDFSPSRFEDKEVSSNVLGCGHFM